MLWRKLIHSVADNQKQDHSAKSMVHSFTRDGNKRRLPDTIEVINEETGSAVLQISQQDFLSRPDHDFWLKKASRKNPEVSIAALSMSFK